MHHVSSDQSLADTLLKHYGQPILSVAVAAGALSLSVRTIYGWQRSPDCPLRILSLGPRRSGVSVADLANYIERLRTAAETSRPRRKGPGRPATRRPRAPRPLNVHEQVEQLKRWLTDTAADRTASASDLHTQYSEWAEEHGERALPEASFERAFARLKAEEKNGGDK